ncbi:SusC/RagA family TonB-linked outer membrane protein [Chitinophaga japonensis]|uniref:SusC/RagA family TonB-linked outer membrane protein n=1 Tax=Chitinophaga japonensis TaxID=104662 RepID=UPI001B86A4D8|nr:SusC/RagA family TonB-linked outer membrane protein [Chitinophaga japonensis]
MKKLRERLSCRAGSRTIKYVLMMKLTIILLVGFMIPAFANTYGQKNISLNLEHTSLKSALKAIEGQGFYRFVYKTRLLSGQEKISVNVQDAPLQEVLNLLLANTSLTYRKVSDKLVVIMHASEPAEQAAVAITVTGKIVDKEGKALPGVSIQEKGTNNGTISEEDGDFTLTVTGSTAVLVVRLVGYETKEIPLAGHTGSQLNIVLEVSNKALQEVVVIGYGTQRKSDITSAVATVKSENFVKGAVVDAGQLLQGKVAGLSISAPSGDPTSGTQILLRGNTTLLGANANPLVLIDGIPGDMRTVAPEDIESIDVLKDGSAAAIYGIRGTNGVILITTRKASGNFVNTVEYSGYVSTETMARKPDMLTAADYRAQIAAGTRDAAWDYGGSTDWIKAVTRTPVSHVHNLTYRGGNSQTNYLLNINYRSMEGIFQKSDDQIFRGRVDINHNMLDGNLKFNFGMISSQEKYTTTGDGSSFNGYTWRQAMWQNPTQPIRDSAGNWFEKPSLFEYENPLARLYESDGRNTEQRTRYNGNITLTPIQGLRLNALFSYSKYNQSRGYSETKQHISTLRDGRNGYASVGAEESVDRLMELTAEYSKTLRSHRFTVLAGYSYQENDFSENWMQNWDFPTDIFSYNNIGSGNAIKEGLAPEYSFRSETNLIGFFGRVTYSYKDRYLFLGSLRREAASQLYGAQKPWGNFPAVSVGWRINREPFMQNVTIFDDLKLRAGYGVTGTAPSALFLGVATLTYGDYYLLNGNWVRSLTPSQNPNPYLKWEEKKETNLGLDFSLLKGRISGSVDYYIRDIDGLLWEYQVPSPPNQYPVTTANVGVMRNRGVEVQLNLVPVQKKNFEWSTTLNYNTNSNKLLRLSNDLYQLATNYFTEGAAGVPIQTHTHLVEIGKEIGNFHGYKVIDISEDGKWIYEGKDGKPVPYDQFNRGFEDKKVIGNGVPRFHAAWNNTLRYKRFDLNVTMRGSFNFQIINSQRMYYENTGYQQVNRLKSAYDKVFGKAVLNTNLPLEFNSYYVEDGDFWKVDNIVLGYNLPETGIKHIRSARIYVSTRNTFMITGYKGIDPEVTWTGLAPGNDSRDKYPTTRAFTIGLNVNF